MFKDKALELRKILLKTSPDDINLLCDSIMKVMNSNNQIIICGNGGSGTTANYFASSFLNLNSINKKIRAVSLNANMSNLIYLAESEGYDQIFSQQLNMLAAPSDLLILISGSGNSPNILKAAQVGKNIGALTFGLTGMEGGKLKLLVDHCIIVDSFDMEQIENAHSILMHWTIDNLLEMSV